MHSIVFKNSENSWKNALPLGNGVLGAMAFYRNNSLSLPLNHYEIYYNISDQVLPKDILEKTPIEKNPGEIHQKYYERAEHNIPKDGEPFHIYRSARDPEKKDHSVSFFSGSYPSTGELCFEFNESLKGCDSELRLDLEDARVKFASDGFDMETYIARRDLIVSEVCGKGCIDAIEIKYPESRDREYPDVSFKEIDKKTFAYEVNMKLSEEKSMNFAGIIRLIGASGKLEKNRIVITESEESFKVICAIFTDWNYSSPLSDGIKKIDEYEASLPEISEEHKKYWQEFFLRSSITLPDKFLERVYYINQYALDCSSGKDGIMKHHACGLNGLWDIRHPSLWGSMWYWDVNIQAAFAGVFSSNRLDLGKVFSDGLLTYVELAEKFANDVHNMSGAAIDYPYHFYYSTWPWCAQYLWAQYEYSQDKEYLKNEAYPLFLKLCEFSCNVFSYDEKRKEYIIYPDISPEQGPLGHNSVITVASVKYMLKFTLEAAEILGDDNEILDRCRTLLNGLPDYPTVTDDWGTRFKDSEDAPPNLWIRHPSMLMPIFPTGEIDIDSDEKQKEIAINSVRFLEENCEIGVFQVSWLAAVAARMGDGQRALRLLYEMGIDHLLRSNGLAAEENERFMNFCLVMRQPLYYPCMMEFTGEMLAAVNEMLMQSNGKIIRLFPAMPNGDPEYDRLIRHGQSIHEYEARCNSYPAWENVSFDKLLARGAFEVSARLEDSKVTYVKIKSLAGGKVRITSPYSLENIARGAGYEITNNILEFDTEVGGEYIFGIENSAPTGENDADVLTHTTYTKRKIYIGEDGDTKYHRALDSFTRDWYLGNVRMENHSVYKFDFGTIRKKEYHKDLFRTAFCAEPMLVHTMQFVQLPELEFSTIRGFGFNKADGIIRVDRGAPDELRRDFVEGEDEVEFLIDVPSGQYELLVASGDECEESATILACDEGRRTGGTVKAGNYQMSLIPVIHDEDGPIRLKVSTTPGKKWKINYILVNLYKQF